MTISAGHRDVNPGENPNFKLYLFENDPNFGKTLSELMPNGSALIGNRYWRISEQGMRIVHAVGKLMFGIAASSPEFTGLSTMTANGTVVENGLTYPVSYLVPVANLQTQFEDPEETITNLAEATNQHLLALGSLCRLPLE